ncbi:DJ-1/PfpI family protein [Streptomyces uncialis]|uniref:DJ-1/PfpI family protein n=1 Tax=Streptomyces uncialis TaxID=1048205 RepID=UPI00382500A6
MSPVDRRTALGSVAGAGVALGLTARPASAAPPTTVPSVAATREEAGRKPLRVDIVAYDGVEELDLFGPLEVFAGAEAMGYPVSTRLVTGGRPGRITMRLGIDVTVTGRWEPEKADVIVVPGGGFRDRVGPGIWAEIDKGTLPRALRAAARPSLTLLGICTGVVLLHASGLVGGKPCTTHSGARPYLREKGADVRDVRVVDAGDLVCGAGVSSGVDSALWMIEREVGSKAAGDVERLLEFERRGTVLLAGEGGRG